MAMKVLLFLVTSLICQGYCQVGSGFQIVAMVSTPEYGREGPTQEWERGLEILPGAHLAVEHINEDPRWLLGNLSIKELVADKEGCNVNTALVDLVQYYLTQTDQYVAGIVGPLCNEVIDIIASVAGHPEINLLQLTTGTSLTFQDKSKYPNLYQMLPLANTYISAVLAIMEKFNWHKIAVLCADSEDSYYCKTAEGFVHHITESNRNNDILFYGEIPSQDTYSVLRYVRESGTKIIVAFLALRRNEVICTAAELGLQWPEYAWILPDHGVRGLPERCPRHRNKDPSSGLLLLQPQLTPHDPKYQLISNISYRRYQKEYQRLLNAQGNGTLDSNRYANVFYDSVWAIALALNNSIFATRLANVSSSSTVPVDKYPGPLNLSYHGALGNIEFDSNHNRINTIVNIQHVKANRTAVRVGHYNPISKTVDVNETLLGTIPTDELERRYELFPIEATSVLSAVAVLCIVFTTLNVVFYWHYRNQPEVKASSTHLSFFMFLGCYLLPIGTLIDVISDSYVTPESSVGDFVCTSIVWTSSIGFDLVFATLLARTLRIYRVFTYFGRTGKIWSDGVLVVAILLIVSIQIFILIFWSAIDTYHIEESEALVLNSKTPYYEITQECTCTYLSIWTAMTLAYTGILFMLLLIFSIKTRKINKRNFKDTKKVSALIFSTGAIICIGLPLWWILKLIDEVIISHALYALGNILVAFICQLYLFAPKTTPAFMRYIHSKMCKRPSLPADTNKGHHPSFCISSYYTNNVL